MKLSALIPVVALASTSMAAAILTPRDSISPSSVKCDTTEGSPLLHHVNKLIENLRNDIADKETCVSSFSPGGDKCPTIKEFPKDTGAAFAVCGPTVSGDLGVSFQITFLLA